MCICLESWMLPNIPHRPQLLIGLTLQQVLSVQLLQELRLAAQEIHNNKPSQISSTIWGLRTSTNHPKFNSELFCTCFWDFWGSQSSAAVIACPLGNAKVNLMEETYSVSAKSSNDTRQPTKVWEFGLNTKLLDHHRSRSISQI